MLGRYGPSEVEAEEAMYGNPYYNNLRNNQVSNSMMIDNTILSHQDGDVRHSMNLARHSRVRSSTNYDYKIGAGYAAIGGGAAHHNHSRESDSNRGEKQDYSMMIDTIDQIQ